MNCWNFEIPEEFPEKFWRNPCRIPGEFAGEFIEEIPETSGRTFRGTPEGIAEKNPDEISIKMLDEFNEFERNFWRSS